ncbi:hypothetical protein Poli38472_003281 [Pythium oligandrum]|uniref:Uncharacterized protein n=1 Tax=Pythium oligandrum TaxID=41045 RepID=A0A8K1C6K3_PYTOL|nr:hypothetical protein Poli38472_003281 [Pythium oligandrum]|eukprot:TMW57356.1 hypothetical protein Poli38472_003281 [Pythium oligandrum]
MDAVSTFKLVSAGVICVLAVAGGVAPLVLKDRVSPTVTSVLNMFAGGIFFAGSCLHLLPDAQANQALADAGCLPSGKCLQLAYVFYALGFLMVMMLEVFAHSVQRSYGVGVLGDEAEEHLPLVLNGTKDRPVAQVQPSEVFSHEEDGHHMKHGRHHHTHVDHKTLYGSAESHGHNDSRYGLGSARDLLNGLSASGEQCVDMEVTHAHIHGIMDVNPAMAFIVFVALSFHSVMEGMGIGASSGAAWDIFVAILAHKSLAAFALALELLHHQVPRERFFATIGIFSLMSPLGIFLGSLMADTNKETIASGICSAMAGGTFLFVAVMETIPQELQNQKCLLGKCAALLAGFSAMGVLSIWT